MIRKILSVVMFLAGIFTMSAQMPQLTPLPLNPKVKTGVLPNGLTYYIMHNEEPKERANFYIAQKVGSTLETKEQLGLAHFLEHMAFNGTTHYPGKAMLEYLQSKGIRFGADINAYTSFDETVYNINNVPTTDKNLMDSVLLALHDWSGEILLEEAEIDAERGVIQEEWRSRNDAQTRMFTAILPQIYEEYQYQQMPIGTMDVVMNFKPEVLRAYYKKWYRPDQQGIVVVGDFDADEMEKKVKELFSTIEMPKNAAKRTYPEVSDNKKPIYATFTDPEISTPSVTIAFKSDPAPVEMRNTVEMYVQTSVLEQIISGLINNRIQEYAQDPNCKFAMAGVYFDDFYVSKTKDAFYVQVIPKSNNTQEAVADAMALVARACKTGFTETELMRVKDEITSTYERFYNEREKTNNDAFGKELCRYFVDNEPAPGVETEYEIIQQVLPSLPVMAINQIVPTILTAENMVIVASEPKKDGFELVAEDVMVKTVQDAMNAQYEAYVDEVITEPLIAELPKPGKITSMVENSELGTITYTLSNGVKVVLKPTDFAADQVVMTAYRDGGKRIYPADQAANVLMAGVAFEASKVGPFDVKTLMKYLSGKQVALQLEIANYTDVLNGFATVKDLPTLMELIYTSFTNLSADQATYDVSAQRMKTQLARVDTDPEAIFFQEVMKTRFDNNPLMLNLNVATVEKADYMQMVDMIHNILKNAAEYTFVFTGNVDNATMRPLLEQYIATLPVALRKKMKVETPINMPQGQVVNEFKKEIQSPITMVYDIYSGNNIPFNAENDIKVSLMGDVLDNIYVATLREEEGGTYGASVGAQINPNTGEWMLIYFFKTNKDQQAQLIKRANDEYMKLLQEGASEADFNKAREAMIKQYEINIRNNAYWDNMLMSYLRGFDYITGYREALEKLTLADFNAFLKTVYNGNNRIQVIMEGTQAK